MTPFLRRLFIGLVVLLAQWLVLGRLRIFGVFPDAVLLYLTIVGLRGGRLQGALLGFLAGFGMDMIYGTWGVQMLSKTIIGFLVGLFAVDQRDSLNITPSQALLGALVIALVHNGVTVIFYALTAGTRTPFLIFGLWIGSAVYTAFLGMIAATFSAVR